MSQKVKPLRLVKAGDIALLDVHGDPLPGLRAGHRYGPLTIHKDHYMGNWVISARGIKITGGWYWENVKNAARELAALGVDWTAPASEWQEAFNRDSALRREFHAICYHYNRTIRVQPRAAQARKEA